MYQGQVNSPSQVLGVQVCATTSGCFLRFTHFIYSAIQTSHNSSLKVFMSMAFDVFWYIFTGMCNQHHSQFWDIFIFWNRSPGSCSSHSLIASILSTPNNQYFMPCLYVISLFRSFHDWNYIIHFLYWLLLTLCLEGSYMLCYVSDRLFIVK